VHFALLAFRASASAASLRSTCRFGKRAATSMRFGFDARGFGRAASRAKRSFFGGLRSGGGNRGVLFGSSVDIRAFERRRTGSPPTTGRNGLSVRANGSGGGATTTRSRPAGVAAFLPRSAFSHVPNARECEPTWCR